jgi:hypothetical protein
VPDAIDRLYARRRLDGHRLGRGPLCGMTMAPQLKRTLEHARRQRRPRTGNGPPALTWSPGHHRPGRDGGAAATHSRRRPLWTARRASAPCRRVTRHTLPAGTVAT